MGVPLGQLSGRRHTDNNTGPHPGTKRLLHEGADGRRRCMSQLAQQLAPAAEERTQEPRNREHDMPVRNRFQQLSPHPLRHSSARFFSQDGQKLRVRQENGTA